MPIFFPIVRTIRLLAVAVLVVGCSQQKEMPDTKTTGTGRPAAHVGKPVTDEECQEFGQKLEHAVASGNKAEIDKLLRINDLYERAISDFGISAILKNSMLKGANKSGAKFSEHMSQTVKAGGTYSCLRVRTLEGRPHILFRFLGGEGLNYHEFTLTRNPDGQIAPEDIRIYATGESMTQSFRKIALGILAQQNPEVVERLPKADQLLARHLDDVRKMAQQVQNGQQKEALAMFRTLPAELQKNKYCQIIAIKAASVNDAAYVAEVERFRRDHPGDPATDLLSIDYYVLKKQLDEALKAIDRVNDAVGGDPYLAQMKVGLLLGVDRYKEAGFVAETAIEADSKSAELYWTRITVAVKEKNHTDTLIWLKKVVEDRGVELDPANISAGEFYAEFIKTPQFQELKQWITARKR